MEGGDWSVGIQLTSFMMLNEQNLARIKRGVQVVMAYEDMQLCEVRGPLRLTLFCESE